MRLHAMHRKNGANRSLLAPIAISVVAWISFPATAGPVRKAEMKFADGDLVTGSIPGGVDRPGTGKITLEPENSAANETPDEMRVNRAGKRNRLIKVAPVASPGDSTRLRF